MRLRRRIFFTLVAILVALFLNPSALALANRVFVSARSGNNANSCDNILTPCQTFAGAVLQLNPSGEAIVLDSGGYGPVTITQAVTIEAPAGVTAFIHPPSGDAITINAGASDRVILRGLTLNGGAGNGITVNTVEYLFVEHCTVTGYGARGIQFTAPNALLIMRDDDVRNSNAAGVYLSSSGLINGGIIRDSFFGGNGTGVVVAEGSNVAITNCMAAGNGEGFVARVATAANADLTLEHVQVANNITGLRAKASGGGTATLRFTNSAVTQNETGILVDTGGTILGSSPGTSVVSGNTTADITGGLGTAVTLQ